MGLNTSSNKKQSEDITNQTIRLELERENEIIDMLEKYGCEKINRKVHEKCSSPKQQIQDSLYIDTINLYL